MRSSHNSVLRTKGNTYRPYRGTLMYKYTGTHSITISPNTGGTLKYFAVSASRLLQVLLLYSLNSTCWIHAFDPQVYQRRIFEDTRDRLSTTSRFYFVPSVRNFVVNHVSHQWLCKLELLHEQPYMIRLHLTLVWRRRCMLWIDFVASVSNSVVGGMCCS